ncbi:MAG: AAA family ATPase, partial [Acidobacteriota bacterium]
PAVHDWIETDDADWLALEWIEGRSLADSAAIDGERIVEILIEVARGLHAAHQVGLTHGQLSADVVVRTVDDRIKLLDLGLSDLDAVEGGDADAAGETAIDRAVVDDLLAFVELTRALVPWSSGATDPTETARGERFARLLARWTAPEGRPRDAASAAQELRAVLEPPTESASPMRHSERRPVTVLAVDLVPDLTASAEPELLLDVVEAVQGLFEDAVERASGRFEGRLAQRWIACFGVPLASEDDARRAVACGLELLAESAAAAAEMGLAASPVRAAVHAGTAIYTVEEATDHVALGPTFDTVAALTERAAAGTLATGDAIRRRTERRVSWRAAGDGLWLAEGGDRASGSPDPRATRAAERTPGGRLVGRDDELETLRQRWREARNGRGHMVLLGGDPGVGKTLLTDAFAAEIGADGEPMRWLELRGTTLGAASPFLPVIGLVRRLLGVSTDDDDSTHLTALEELARRADLPPAEVVPHLGLLLGVAPGATDAEPRLRKRRILEALALVLTELALDRPMVLLIDDLQWIDPSTVDLLTLLAEQIGTVPMLLVATHRTTFRPPWQNGPRVTELRIERFDEARSRRVLDLLLGGRTLPEPLVLQLIERADGVPLYLEELTRSVLESGQLVASDGAYRLVSAQAELRVPATLRESLAARLDRLGDARPVALAAAVIGRSFSRSLLAAVVERGSGPLDDALERLVAADLVQRRGFGRRAVYEFRHALLREEAYGSLLRRDRRRRHLRVAEALETEFPSLVEDRPDTLAHHLVEAGRPARSIPFWQRAGDRAVLASANREAVSLFRSALRAIEGVRPSAADGVETREAHELELQLRLGRALSSLRGYSDAEVGRAFGRARELAARTTDTSRTFGVTAGLWAYRTTRAEIDLGLEHAKALLGQVDLETPPEVERSPKDLDRELSALGINAISRFLRGDLQKVLELTERALALESAHPDRASTTYSPGDFGAGAGAVRALALWQLGRSEDARKASRWALERAQGLGKAYSYVFVLSWATQLQHWLGERDTLDRMAEEMIARSEDKGFFWITIGWFFRGCTLAMRALDDDQPETQLAEADGWMSRGLQAFLSTGAVGSMSYFLTEHAAVDLARGRFDDATEKLEQAGRTAGAGFERMWQAEIHRRRGDVATQRGDREAAQSEYSTALEAAERIGSVALQLRAARSLAGWHFEAGETERARSILEPAIEALPQRSDEVDAARRWLAGLSEA